MKRSRKEPLDCDIADLKRSIRREMKHAAAHGRMDGHAILGALMAVGAEMVAAVDDDVIRKEFVESVVRFFPHAVIMERELPPYDRKLQ